MRDYEEPRRRELQYAVTALARDIDRLLDEEWDRYDTLRAAALAVVELSRVTNPSAPPHAGARDEAIRKLAEVLGYQPPAEVRGETEDANA